MVNIEQKHLTRTQKMIKYILMGLLIIIATRYIPDNALKNKEIIMIGATSSIVFAILDMVSPAIQVTQSAKIEREVFIEV